MKLILASQSSRRSELLRNARFDFDVILSGVDEPKPVPGERPEQYARALAQSKALSVAAAATPGALVLGADTIVTIDGVILGKPVDAADATRMLELLSGKTHEVITAISLVRAPNQIAALEHEATQVTFSPLSKAEIIWYVANEEPFDKAGAYGIQGLASRFVARISGCYFNVVGLPVPLLYRTLLNCGTFTMDATI